MLVAVHLSDVLTTPAAALGWAAAALLVWRAERGLGDDEIARVGVVTAAFFVGSQVHLPAGVGSVHLLLNGVAGVALGRRAPVAIAVGLLLQALLFGHGGLQSLGANITCYALPALAARPLLRAASRLVRTSAAGFVTGGVVAFATVALSAAALAVGGDAAVRGAAPLFAAMNLPLVVVEAAATAVAAVHLAGARPGSASAGERH